MKDAGTGNASFVTPLGWAQSRCNPKIYPKFSEGPCYCLGDSRLSPDQSKQILDNACRSYAFKVNKSKFQGEGVGAPPKKRTCVKLVLARHQIVVLSTAQM